MIDSGCSHDMHPGGMLGTRAFGSYRKFDRPLVVHFAKKGTTAHAVGVGEMMLSGCSGPVVLPEVLHVPALQDPLFSVRAALSRRMSVHFCPREQPDRLDDVIITHDGRLCLTVRMYSGLYFLDEHPSAAATLTAAPISVQQLTRAWECHRRLGHLGFNTLAGLSRKGMLADETLTPTEFVQAGKEQVCKPCVVGKLWRTSQPLRVPMPVRVLHRVHISVTCHMVGTSER
jgi:hypothetical protein